ncbi:MAG: formylglycine-generating enzyme family protein [Planctomycetota bacterium]
MLLNLFTKNKKTTGDRRPKKAAEVRITKPTDSPAGSAPFMPAPRETWDADPLKRLFQQGRYNIILREETKWRGHPGGNVILQEVKNELEQRMALVPAGTVGIPKTLNAQPGGPEEEVEVAPLLMAVHAVTNARFQKFVDGGGYDELSLWPEEIWPHLIELKDQTGHPGPRFWRNGRHDLTFTDHPVVGVSWYEAQAYALWVGQRMPSEAEWQMAASWHIKSSADLMRRFPWGDAMDMTRCNLWSSKNRGTLSVTSYPKGAAPNHVLQLVGNVWEWSDSEFNVTDDAGRPIVGEMPMHVVRGGAFDTYFETQATSQFRTGQLALSRTHNTGFRCAMDLCDATWITGG